MPNCDKCIWSTRSGNCVLWECKFVSYEDARRMIEEKERKDEKAVRTMSITIEQAIAQYEQFANVCEHHGLTASQEEFEQLADWLRELQERRKAPEIVRCGECRHKGTKNCVANTWAAIFGFEVKDDFYCGLAERRTDK